MVRVIPIPILEKIVGKGVIKLKDPVTGVEMSHGVAGENLNMNTLVTDVMELLVVKENILAHWIQVSYSI